MRQPTKRDSGPNLPPSSSLRASEPLRSQFADDPEMSELVGLFVSELPARLAALESAWSAGDSPVLRRLAHQLKGAGAGYGFPAVSDAAGDVETALLACGGAPEAADLAQVNGKVQALLALCRRASGTKVG